MSLLQTYKINIQGVVQGVGFRPFVFNLASSMDLFGEVSNSSKGVEIIINTSKEQFTEFFSRLIKEAPPLSHINSYRFSIIDKKEYKDFSIVKSQSDGGVTFVSPDTAICSDCSNELMDDEDQRFAYPFINCTNCGPRYSIIQNLPYDRPFTTMNVFEMCQRCEEEYNDPSNRRFHAQPNCCPDCGPEVYMPDGTRGEKAVLKTADVINAGGIAAVKGLGGYHLICDATNDKAVKTLRERKNRKEKPFAVMYRNVDVIKESRGLTREEEAFLNGHEAPILLLEWKGHGLSEYVNPIDSRLGLMKAYTPLHIQIFKHLKTDYIIATSGNRKDEPICSDERDAEGSLGGFVDCFLHHNRDIHMPVDDSVATMFRDSFYLLRRARGFAPYPVMLPVELRSNVVGMGAHLKSTITLGTNSYAFVSQYLGDLDNIKCEDFYEKVYNNLTNLYGVFPDLVITDTHPDYYSSVYPERLGKKILKVQHHHAHMYACMAENGLTDKVIGVIFDGTGLGLDSKMWGGEIFSLNNSIIKRHAHLKYVPMPGGDAAAKKPGRMLISYLISAGVYEKYNKILSSRMDFESGEIDLVYQMVNKKINSIETSGMGRLFEAMGSFLTGSVSNDFEAHQAMKLESMVDKTEKGFYHVVKEDGFICGDKIIESAVGDFLKGTSREVVAARFHNTIARETLRCCEKVRIETGNNEVVLSGGVFQNMLLLEKVTALLEENRFNVNVHSRVPANDGSISLGQVYYAALNYLS